MIDIQDLEIIFRRGGQEIRAVNGVSLQVEAGTVTALLGESGSGKSVTLRALLRLHSPQRTRISGAIKIAERDIMALSEAEMSRMRGPVISMVFQEPMLALDPVYTLGAQITETIRRHENVPLAQAKVRALELFELVRIPSARLRLDAYPHEMSGGMRQRAMIALALACRPQILLADEPTTALDATVQIQILLLLRDLQREMGLSVIFVTHDIGVAVEIADKIAVMYAGRIVESGRVPDILRHPRHPYTQGLLASRVDQAVPGQRLKTIPGAPPDLANLPSGCGFAPRCSRATAECSLAVPDLRQAAICHEVACIHALENHPAG